MIGICVAQVGGSLLGGMDQILVSRTTLIPQEYLHSPLFQPGLRPSTASNYEMQSKYCLDFFFPNIGQPTNPLFLANYKDLYSIRDAVNEGSAGKRNAQKNKYTDTDLLTYLPLQPH